jgi:WhiB family redox-sensing transcriptional regulator
VSWFERAACKGADPNIWFPAKSDGTDDSDNHGRQAKAICATCPVRLDCLVDALQRNEDGGIWGGAGEPTRRALVRVLPAATHQPDDLPDVCGCAWCELVAAFFAGDVIDSNGPGATHYHRVTYGRGCRCFACRLATSEYGEDQTNLNRRRNYYGNRSSA